MSRDVVGVQFSYQMRKHCSFIGVERTRCTLSKGNTTMAFASSTMLRHTANSVAGLPCCLMPRAGRVSSATSSLLRRD